tara:strand:+ start:552 stop:1148 length:597 start_codon:yes stop_codon:yes gene_type:complete
MTRVLTQHKFYRFGPYLAEMAVEPDYCARLLETGKKLKKSHKEHLVGQIDHEYTYDFKKDPWIVERFQVYINTWIEGWKKFSIKPDFNPKSELFNMWINRMKAKEYNPPHIHTNCSLSFVLWLEVPPAILKEKNLTSAPNPGTTTFVYGEDRWNIVSEQTIVPKVNTMVMFPAHLRHSVMHFNSKVIRTSVAGNIKFT